MQRADEHRTQHETDRGLSKITTLTFAVAAGLSVANIYYAQPLLDSMAHDFGIAPSAIGLVVTLTMAYAQAGWSGVSMLGASFSSVALLTWAGTLRLPISREKTVCIGDPAIEPIDCWD